MLILHGFMNHCCVGEKKMREKSSSFIRYWLCLVMRWWGCMNHYLLKLFGIMDAEWFLRAGWWCSVVELHKKITYIYYFWSASEQYSWILLSSKHFSLPKRKKYLTEVILQCSFKKEKNKTEKKKEIPLWDTRMFNEFSSPLFLW